jgi:dipeptidase E
VTTAGNTSPDPWWIEKDRKRLKKLGFVISEIDIKDKNIKQLDKFLFDKEVLYVAGGNSFYLLEKIRKSGLDVLIPKLLGRGMMYIGTSAGAVVAGPDLKPIALLDDPSEAPDLKSTKALGLVAFMPLPHYGRAQFARQYKKIMKKFRKKYKLVTITDRQAIIVVGDRYKIIDSE